MRHKSEEKYEAILQATLRLVTELGFHGLSMSKIAKEAGVAPATIYIYFENKEDLINTLYQEVKEIIVKDIMKGYHAGMPSRQAFELIWHNYYKSIIAHSPEFSFLEQFANSPYISSVSREEGKRIFEPYITFFQQAIDAGAIKPMPFSMLQAFFSAPMNALAKQEIATGEKLSGEDLKLAIDSAWRSVTT